MTQYEPWDDIKKTCEMLGLFDPQIVNGAIWAFRGQDVQPTALSKEEINQIIRLTLDRLLHEDRTHQKYARLLMPLCFLSAFLITVGIHTHSLDGFAAIYQSAPSWIAKLILSRGFLHRSHCL